jgi:hypothetical protein
MRVRSVEFASDKPSIPPQGGVRQSGNGHFAERLAAESVTDFAKRRSLLESIRRPFNWPFRIRFSATKYSLRKSDSWMPRRK